MRIYKKIHLIALEYSFEFGILIRFAENEKRGSKIITCICYNVKIEYNFNIIYAKIYKNIKNIMKEVGDYVTTVT